MSIKLTKIPDSKACDLTDRETVLLQLLREREERIQQLEDEIARLKGEKGKPKIKPSRLESQEKVQKEETDWESAENEDKKEKKKRPQRGEAPQDS